MKKLKGLKLVLVISAILCILLGSTLVANAATPALNITKGTMRWDATYQMRLKNYTGTVKWQSSNANVVSVNSKGLLKARRVGTANIYAIAGNKKYTCAITVRPVRIAIPVTNTRRYAQEIASINRRSHAAKVYCIGSTFDVNLYDGLLLPGGDDIDPARYGQRQNGCNAITSTTRAADKLEFNALAKFVKAKKPVLGICKGMQVINVYFGGTLKQNINGHRNGIYHYVKSIKGTPMYTTYSKYNGRINVMSLHHQCINKLGSGLVVTMRAEKDNVIEAIQHKTLPIFGVQWHPDIMYNNGNDLGRKTIDLFICAVAGRKCLAF